MPLAHGFFGVPGADHRGPAPRGGHNNARADYKAVRVSRTGLAHYIAALDSGGPRAWQRPHPATSRILRLGELQAQHRVHRSDNRLFHGSAHLNFIGFSAGGRPLG